MVLEFFLCYTVSIRYVARRSSQTRCSLRLRNCASDPLKATFVIAAVEERKVSDKARKSEETIPY